MFLNPWYGNPVRGSGDADPSSQMGMSPAAPLSDSPALVALGALQARLRPGWTIHLLRNGRFFYCNHASQTSSWLPPAENWCSGGSGLPYGWETAVDKDGKTYFINHLNKTTSYEDPRRDLQEEPPQPRVVELTRDADMGFGFVAGSEKPVIVRFVTDGGPSVDKLLPGDQILMINGEDVKKAPRDHVIQLVRSCKEFVSLTVCQPPLDNSARKSALLSAAKKQRLKNNPSRVRFAESVDINGSTSQSPSQISSSESTTPFMPNVLKVFLENGQTKSFKYDSSTTVGDVLESLHQKLGIKCQEHFSLVVEHVKSLRRNKLTLLDPQETLTKIAARPGAQHLRCLYRITFVPRDAYDLLRKDSVAFEYLFLQCCNDVIQERFSPELKYDVALRLAALHIHQHSLSSSTNSKISLKTIERECGLDRFVPTSLVESMKRKELRKLLSHFLKLNGSLTAPGQKQLTALQAKLHYLKIISELPSYGAKCFSTNIMEGNMESVMLISPRFGISQITGIRNSMPEPICEIEQVTSISVARDDGFSMKVEIALKHPDKDNLVVSVDDRDAEELVLVLRGYYRLLTEKSLPVSFEKDCSREEKEVPSGAPPYHSCHQVQSSPWSYVTAPDDDMRQVTKVVDLSHAPPYQHIPDGYTIPNGNIPRYNDSDSSNSQGGCLRIPMLDSNMNKTMSLYDNTEGEGLTAYDPTYAPSLTSASVELHQPNSRNAASRSASGPYRQEPKPNDVSSKTMEMRRVVEDAEAYVSDPEAEVTDVESVRSESYGKLKHSDSLLLLTQGQKMVTKLELPESEERSESDTDSQSTPQTSPAHKPSASSPPCRPSSIVKTSGSSFGLHSPDNLPMDLENPENNIKALIRQLEDNSGLPYTFAEGTLYLDPDIIDLTMIPPPITPDEEGAKMLPSQLSTPPTPFADRESLDQELKALERDVGDLRTLTNNWVETGTLQSVATSESSTTGASDTDDTLSLSSVSTGNDSMRRNSTLVNFLKQNGSAGGPGFTLAALRQLGINLGEGEDIDSFIANLTIPPPPEGSAILQQYKEARKMGGGYDINAFIIPPPPSNSANDHRSSDIIRRLYEAKEGISKVVGDTEGEGAEKDNVVDEVRVISKQMQKSFIQSGRVASLQKHFESSNISPFPGNKEESPSELNERNFRYNKNKLNLINELSSQNNVRVKQSIFCRETDAKLAEALAENDKMFQNFESSPKHHSFMPEANRGDISPQISPLNKVPSSNSKTRQIVPPVLRRETDSPVPSIPEKKKILNHSKTFEDDSSFCKIGNGILSKSASQGDITVERIKPKVLSPITINKSSVSNEDLRQNSWNDSRQNIASSNDSLTSSSSITTVKSVSIKSLDKEEDPPELPPRKNSAKTVVRPPLPRNNSADNAKCVPSVKGIRTPSPIRRARRTPSPESVEKPPAIPTRTKKSPSPTNTLPLPQKTKLPLKGTAPKPPTVVPKTSGDSVQTSPQTSTLPKKLTKREEKPELPSKTFHTTPSKKQPSVNILKNPKNSGSPLRQPSSDHTISMKNTYNDDPPLHTSSPKLPPKTKILNGKVSGNELDDSLDSGSFDQDSLEETEEVEAMLPASRDAYRQVALVVSESLKTLSNMSVKCSNWHHEGENPTKDEESFQKMKEALTSESRQFVTASKLFVKSATESEEVLLNSLSKCMSILERMITTSQHVVDSTSTPLQTQNLVLKVRDVASAYLSTVRSALSASGRGMDHPSMNTLMEQATNLAGVLTSLMRTLKVFTP